MDTSSEPLSRQEAIDRLWRLGRLRFKLFPDQQEVYDVIWAFLTAPGTRFEQFWFDISRQWGKTFLGLLISVECALRNPGWDIGYTAATRTALWQFVQPNMDVLLDDCPGDLSPDWNGLTNDYVFQNGSRIHLAGVNNGHENDARGPRRHLMVNEEACFVDRYDYLVKSVELPMLTTTGGRILNISTPPETPAHESRETMVKCKARRHYVRRTIEDNRHLSEAAKAKLIEEAGGRDSTTARRELFCEWITDESRAIVPEYNEKADGEIAVEPEPPTFEQPLVAMDVGFEDLHAVLFGYYDFRRAKLVVQDEVILRRARTDQIAEAIKAKEAELWGERVKSGTLREPVRWSDTDLRLIADLSELHGLHFGPTAKDDKEAQVNALRIRVKNRGIQIDPRCEALRAHLMLGVWNKQRTEFDHSKEHGHFDAVDALIYMARNADVYDNPYPALPAGVTQYTHHIPLRLVNQHTETAQALGQAFRRKHGR